MVRDALAEDVADLRDAWGPRFALRRAVEIVVTLALFLRTSGHVLGYVATHPDHDLTDEVVRYELGHPIDTPDGRGHAVQRACWVSLGFFALFWLVDNATLGFALERVPTLVQWWLLANAAVLFGDPVWTGLFKIRERRRRSDDAPTPE